MTHAKLRCVQKERQLNKCNMHVRQFKDTPTKNGSSIATLILNKISVIYACIT